MLKDFKTFINRGSAVDLAVGVIIGAAFGKIVASLVNDVVMPPLGVLIGKTDFKNLFISLDGKTYASLEAAKEAGGATLNYGVFINTVIEFSLVAIAVFLMVKAFNRMRAVISRVDEEAPEPAPVLKECPQCMNMIPCKATRCGHCTSVLVIET